MATPLHLPGNNRKAAPVVRQHEKQSQESKSKQHIRTCTCCTLEHSATVGNMLPDTFLLLQAIELKMIQASYYTLLQSL